MEEVRFSSCTPLSALSENYSMKLLGKSVSLSKCPLHRAGHCRHSARELVTFHALQKFC